MTSPRNAPTSNPWGAIRSSSEIASPRPLGFGNDGSQNSGGYFGGSGNGGGNGDVEEGRGRLNEFETSLPIRLDYEACLAYLLLPPAGGVLLLVLEHKSDYVRYVSPRTPLLPCSLSCLQDGMAGKCDKAKKRRGRNRKANLTYRFHAWQSSILFSILFVLHLVLSWSRFLSWVLFLVDLGAIGYLTMRAYRDGKYHIYPSFGAQS